MDTFPFRIIEKPKLGSNTASDYFFQGERKASPYEVWTTPPKDVECEIEEE